MGSPFIERFVEQVVGRLLELEQIEITPGSAQPLVEGVAARLTHLPEGAQLIASLSRALIESPHVEELYADDTELKEIVGDLGSAWMR